MKVLCFASLLAAVVAQQGAWWRCGGINYNGGKTCIAGYSCVYLNDWYSQCQPNGQATSAATTLVTSTKAAASTTTPTTLATSTVKVAVPTSTGTIVSRHKFKWFGVDESVAEWGGNSLPGTYGIDFIWPSISNIDALMNQGFNIFRIAFLMERMVPNQLYGPVAPDYLANMTAIVNHITQRGGYAVLDPHNYGRYYGNIITDTAGFQAFWKTLASNFKSNSRAIFDTNNEFHDIDQTLVYNLNQAAINGIRSAGATTQYIFVEGNGWSGAWNWANTNDGLKSLVDSSNKIIYEMHQYLDSDSSGTHDACVSTTVGADRIASATAWLRANKKQAVLGEFAGGANSQCMTAVTGMLNAMQAASDVWLGALFWSGGPWWGTYMFSFEGPGATGYDYYDSTLQKYTP